jgi:hypothetical protein
MGEPFWRLERRQVEAGTAEALGRLSDLAATFSGGGGGGGGGAPGGSAPAGGGPGGGKLAVEARAAALGVAEEARAKVAAFQAKVKARSEEEWLFEPGSAPRCCLPGLARVAAITSSPSCPTVPTLAPPRCRYSPRCATRQCASATGARSPRWWGLRSGATRCGPE